MNGVITVCRGRRDLVGPKGFRVILVMQGVMVRLENLDFLDKVCDNTCISIDLLYSACKYIVMILVQKMKIYKVVFKFHFTREV